MLFNFTIFSFCYLFPGYQAYSDTSFTPMIPIPVLIRPLLSLYLLLSQSLSEKLVRKEKEHQELEQCLGAEKTAKKGVQDSLRERELEVQELQARATGAEASLQKTQTELGERTEEVAKLKREMAELEVKHAELKVERKQLEQQREEKESQGAQQQTEISQVRETDRDTHRLLHAVQHDK